MPGIWEIRQANSVAVCILHTDTTTIAWSFGLRNLIIPGRDELRRFNPFIPLAGMPYDNARNNGTEASLRLGAEWVFHYDSDVVPPRDAILRLMRHNLPIVSGMYCRRSPPHAVPVMIRQGQWVTDFIPGSMVEVDMVGAGCLLLHRSFLENIPPQRPGKRWFDWRVDMAGHVPKDVDCTSEDFTLCNHARRHGYKIMVDTSIVCRHIGYAEAGLGEFKPCEVAVHT